MQDIDIEFSAPDIEEFQKNNLWSNKHNVKFYEMMPNSLYEKLVKNAGIDENQDINNIKNYILMASSIFEVGLCLGRVIKACRKVGYKSKFSGIEITPKFCKELKVNFPETTIYEGDFLEFKSSKKHDLILLMGSTLSAFFLDEQRACIVKIKEIIDANGHLIIDNYIEHRKPINKGSLPSSNNGVYAIQANGECHAGYLPTIEEIHKMAKGAGFKAIEERKYMASNDIYRVSLIYQAY